MAMILSEPLTVDANSCVLWPRVDEDGYAVCSWRRIAGRAGTAQRVHRLLFEAVYGVLPPDYHVHHDCRNKACCNVEHMEALTTAEHTIRHCEEDGHHNTRKTHCPHGHEYTPENTIIGKSGSRFCRSCQREKGAEFRQRMKAVAA